MPDMEPLTGTELALLDAIKTLSGALITLDPRMAEILPESFAHQRDGNLQGGQLQAAAVFSLLHDFVADPERQKAREEARLLLKEEPKGTA